VTQDAAGPDGSGRLEALLRDLTALYPGAEARLSPAPSDPEGDAVRQFRVVLSSSRPRAAVPVDAPGAVRAFLRRDSAGDRRAHSAARRVVSAIAAGPLARVVFPATITVSPTGASSIEAYLAEVTGGPVRVSLATGSERANAKPVLGVATVAGEELGFCKVGLTPLARRLVKHEAEVLARLAGHLRRVVVPTVLHSGRWRGNEVLFLSAVRGNRGRGAILPVEAMREVAATDGTGQRHLVSSPWVAALRQRASAAPPELARTILTLLARLLERAERSGLREVLHGASHGDWGPWNMAWDGGRVVVWDWERYGGGLPVGLDAVHFLAHEELSVEGDLAGALALLDGTAEPAVRTVLSGWPGTDHDRATAAHFVVDAYLLEVACRFAADTVLVPAARVSRAAHWYLQVAGARLGSVVDRQPAVATPRHAGPDGSGR